MSDKRYVVWNEKPSLRGTSWWKLLRLKPGQRITIDHGQLPKPVEAVFLRRRGRWFRFRIKQRDAFVGLEWLPDARYAEKAGISMLPARCLVCKNNRVAYRSEGL